MYPGWRMMAIMGAVFLAGVQIVEAGIDAHYEYFSCDAIDSPTSDYQFIMERASHDLIEHTGPDNYDHCDKIDLGLTLGYGRAMCRKGMSYGDCNICLYVANNYRIRDCKFSKGSRVKLTDCYMRLEDYEFDDRFDAIMGARGKAAISRGIAL
ncbi:hypothetical protein MLD38_030061 [Melastoma candidum]|uniref:Uncharacterized protein n=1 Tax=Melastoma candidum TaxID=119954 RepID=A0ACB9MP36_9MYRT|nr:hypothetical protein MLD38_030061 [Melastoma candidum]